MADSVVVVDNGLDHIADAILALGATAPKWIEWGTGVVAPARTDVDLGTPSAEARTEGTDSVQDSGDTSAAADIYRTIGTITEESAGPIAHTEVGTWTNLTVGVLFLRATHDAINTMLGNSIEYTIDTKFAPA